MPRANRYILPGSICHVTHRCHDGSFLLKFGVHRTEYCRRIRRAIEKVGVSLFGYSLTSNHIHILARSQRPGDISQFMQCLEGQFSNYYNSRKDRCGAFWKGRFHATMVETGEHLANCMRYIDLNMVRAGVVAHPSEWRWCGYHELVGARHRYRLLDIDSLLPLISMPDRCMLADLHRQAIDSWIERRRLNREGIWTESIAVGTESFVRAIAEKTKRRKRLHLALGREGAWFVREKDGGYGY